MTQHRPHRTARAAGGRVMEYYEQINNCQDCSWPLLPADRANDEIARLQSIVDSLKWANDLKDELIHEAAGEIARLRKDVRNLIDLIEVVR